MSVKVAIRVRPFNQRETFLGCICCVDMKENTTVLYENKQKNKKQHYFTFDYSLWSHDEFKVRQDGYMIPTSDKYVDQHKVYDMIGREILANAWQGYNCCLFAYGQTGAGKSYSMIGYGVNRGIIPLVSQQLFQRIRKYQKKGEKQYEISLSMLEIYNEKVQDLFTPTSKRPQNGLKVRENKTLGVYVQGLTKHQVFSYTDIERRMDQGSKNRSLASTLMNEYSSRAHTIIIIEFVQKQWINKLKMNKKSSFINLVDLAGSERVSKTGIIDNKDRLKEASNINKSLHTLGRVIQTLAQQAAGKGKVLQVPYRDSALTRILQTALGGNSKTIMICAISPANDNYQETLSTLRYADQTKKIKNKPIVNQSAVDKIIRELREENQRLKKILETSEENSLANSRDLTTETEKKQIRSNLRASMREVQKQIKKNLKSFAINTDQIDDEDESLMMTQFIDLEQPSQFFSQLSFDLGNKAQVYITNLNEDELLNYKIRYSCERDILITNKNNKKTLKGMQDSAKIVLCGLGIQENHAKIIRKGDKYYIEALSDTSSEYTLLNGKPVYERKQLQHNDRIILGINSVFIFKNNLKKNQQKQTKIDYQFVINERQQEMQNISLISPTSLNLFLSNNLINGNKSRDIYSNPPLQSLNLTRKLFEQENQNQILNKLAQIQSEFEKLVKENDQKMKEKEQFYRNRLSEMKKQKEKQKIQKSTLQEQLMMKSLESQNLKTKNYQLQKLKSKLSKYNQQKDRRKKVRESMLLQSQDANNVIEQDIIGQFIQLEDPNSEYARDKIRIQFEKTSLRGKQISDAEVLASTKQFLIKNTSKNNRNSYNYEDIIVEQFQNTDQIIKSSIRMRADSNVSNQSLLINQEEMNEKRNKIKKSGKKEEKQNQNEELRRAEIMKESQRRKARFWQFRRLYNIKVQCEMQNDLICQNCNKMFQQNSNHFTNPIDDSFIIKYLPDDGFKDADLQQFSYKNTKQKKTITREEMQILQHQILQLESRLAKNALDEKSYDDMLLNYSMDRESLANRQNSVLRDSFGRRKFSDSYDKDFQLNLTIDQPPLKVKQELKQVVNEFISVLADMPQLDFCYATDIKINPTKPKKKVLKEQYAMEFMYRPVRKIMALKQLQEVSFHMQYQTEKAMNVEVNNQNNKEQELQPIQEDHLSNQQLTDNQTENQTDDKIQKILCEFGVNTEQCEQQSINEKARTTSFTAFLNEQFEQSNQNNTQENHEPQYNTKEYADAAINTQQIQEQSSIKKDNEQIQDAEAGLKANERKSWMDMEMMTDINMKTQSEFKLQKHSQQPIIQEQDANYIQNQTQAVIAQAQKQNRDGVSEQQQLLQQFLQKQQDNEKDEDQLQEYLKNRREVMDRSINTTQIEQQETQTNTSIILKKNVQINVDIEKIKEDTGVNTSFVEKKQEVLQQHDEQLQNYIAGKEEEEEIQNYVQGNEEEDQIDNYLKIEKQESIEFKELNGSEKEIVKKISEKIIQNKIKSLSLKSQQIQFNMTETNGIQSEDRSPIRNLYQSQDLKQVLQPLKSRSFDIYSETISLTIAVDANNQLQLQDSKKINKQRQLKEDSLFADRVIEQQIHAKPEMIDQQVQLNSYELIDSQKQINELDNSKGKNSEAQSSNQYQKTKRNKKRSFENSDIKNKQSNSQQIAKEFNLSFSDIEKHDFSYQDMSAMGFDGLLKQDELNSKIKLLEDKIKQLQNQSQKKQEPIKEEQIAPVQEIQIATQDNNEIQEILAKSKNEALQEQNNNSKYVPVRRNKKKKKKNQMTEQERKQHQIQKQIQAKIIQCNNQNLINQRNLQIHKRKREGEELRKILFKKQKVELQKILLVLIPMVRRFNLIAREMKRLIQAKISIQYRNFSHYQMIEVLKNHSKNKQNGNGSNIQIKIVILNCQQGRIYTWPSEVFKNRYEIAQQTFQKYLQNDQDPDLGKSRAHQDPNQRSKDPFWDPVDYIPQGVAYLSMQVLLYNLSYQGYVSLVYRSAIIAKIYIAITPVKVKKHNDEQQGEQDNEEQSQLDHIQIYNQRNLLQKDIYFTISVQSIKFMKTEERQKLDESSHNINLTSLNSNILKYTISYQLLQCDYKLITYSTPQIDFVEDKQFKRIQYMRRHCFKNVTEATLGYISDCPIKFTLNVMKDYNQECLNASFNNQDFSQSDQDQHESDTSLVKSIGHDDKSVRSRKVSQVSISSINSPKTGSNAKSDFSKKPSNVIYENTEVISKLDADAKKQQQKRDKIRKIEQSRLKNSKPQKDKDKDCTIY